MRRASVLDTHFYQPQMHCRPMMQSWEATMNHDLALSCGCVHCRRVFPTVLVPTRCPAKRASNAAKATEPFATETERLRGIWFSNSKWIRGKAVEWLGLGVGDYGWTGFSHDRMHERWGGPWALINHLRTEVTEVPVGIS